MDRQMKGWKDSWIDGMMDREMDGCINGWIDDNNNNNNMFIVLNPKEFRRHIQESESL